MFKSHRAAFLILACAYVLPIATAFCCCVETPVIDSSSHSNQGSEHYGESHHGHDHDRGDSRSTHSHSECDHSEIVAVLNHVNGQFVSIFSAPGNYFKISEPQGFNPVEVSAVLPSPPLGIGPPGHSLSTPLYLQNLVLRI